MLISIIGTEYLGAVHAACIANFGNTVVGIDTDADKVAALSAGRPSIYQPGLETLLREQLASGRLTVSTAMATAAATGVHFVCVGTPQLPNSNAADTSYVFEAVQALAPVMRPDAVVVGKSTVPVGTARQLHSGVTFDLQVEIDIDKRATGETADADFVAPHSDRTAPMVRSTMGRRWWATPIVDLPRNWLCTPK